MILVRLMEKEEKKLKLGRAGILLVVTLAIPLAILILAVLSVLIGEGDAAFALFLFSTVSVYVSFAAGVLVPVGIAIVLLVGRNVERQRMLLLLSVANIALAIIWFYAIVPQLHIRW